MSGAAMKMARYRLMAEGAGNKERMNYDVDDRFRDSRGREHYDNGRFAPMRNEMPPDMNYRPEYRGNRNEYRMGDYETDNRMDGDRRDMENRRRGSRYEYDGEEMRMGGDRMNMIGFGDREPANQYYPTPWYNETEGNYGGRMENHHGMDMERHTGMKEAGGASTAGMGLTEHKAKEWVKSMKGDDGTGEHWNMDQIKRLMTQKGVDADHIEMYAIMNALYSDYCKVFKKYGVTSPDFYMELAQAWLNDKDAVKDKAAAYYEHIVKH